MILFFSSAESDIHSQLSVVMMRIKEKNSSDFKYIYILKIKKILTGDAETTLEGACIKSCYLLLQGYNHQPSGKLFITKLIMTLNKKFDFYTEVP